MPGRLKRNTNRHLPGARADKRAMIEAAVAERCAQIRTLYRFLGSLRKAASASRRARTVISIADLREYEVLESALRDATHRALTCASLAGTVPVQRQPAGQRSAGIRCLARLLIPSSRIDAFIKVLGARIDAFHQRNREDWERHRLLGSTEGLTIRPQALYLASE